MAQGWVIVGWCGLLLAALPPARMEHTPPCADSSPACANWAKQGECKANPGSVRGAVVACKPGANTQPRHCWQVYEGNVPQELQLLRAKSCSSHGNGPASAAAATARADPAAGIAEAAEATESCAAAAE